MTVGNTQDLPAKNLIATLRVPVQLWVVALVMAIGFAGGFAVRGLSSTQTPTSVVTNGDVSGRSGQVAPPLTHHQMNAGLPAGHPSISATTTQGVTSPSTSSTAPTTTTTAP